MRLNLLFDGSEVGVEIQKQPTQHKNSSSREAKTGIGGPVLRINMLKDYYK
jgi:hypothetical protein